MRRLVGDDKGEGEEGVCVVGGLLFQKDFDVRRKKCTRTAAPGGGQSARTTSLIQPYDRELSQRSLVRDLTDSGLRTSSQQVFTGW